MLDEFNEVKYFKEVAYFKGLKRKNFKEIKRLKSLQVKKQRRIQNLSENLRCSFLWIYLTVYCFCNKSSITDVRLGYIWATENIEIFKVKLLWSKLSWLLQRVAFLVCYLLLRPEFNFLQLLDIKTCIGREKNACFGFNIITVKAGAIVKTEAVVGKCSVKKVLLNI